MSASQGPQGPLHITSSTRESWVPARTRVTQLGMEPSSRPQAAYLDVAPLSRGSPSQFPPHPRTFHALPPPTSELQLL